MANHFIDKAESARILMRYLGPPSAPSKQNGFVPHAVPAAIPDSAVMRA
jgi:hypothetical protein